jgi:hypothetical protein
VDRGDDNAQRADAQVFGKWSYAANSFERNSFARLLNAFEMRRRQASESG